MLHHLVESKHTDGTDQSVHIDRHSTRFSGDRIAWPLHDERKSVTPDDLINPAFFDHENVACNVHIVLEVSDKFFNIAPGIIRRSRAIQRNDLERSHREVGTIPEINLIVKFIVFIDVR